MGIGIRRTVRPKKRYPGTGIREGGVVKVGGKQSNSDKNNKTNWVIESNWRSMMKNNRKRWSVKGSDAALQPLKCKQLGGGGGAYGVYEPPRLLDLKWQNRVKTRKHYVKWRNPPDAPRNTSTYILQSKRAGALGFLASPAVDVASLPASSPLPLYREVVMEEVKQWGVDGYGSMTNLIRLRSSDDDSDMGSVHVDRTADGDYVQSGGDGTAQQQSMRGVEQRLEQDLVRFELTYPPKRGEELPVLQRRVEEQDQQIAALEDENLTLRERVYLLQQEMGDMRQRLGLTGSTRLGVPDDAYSELVDVVSDAV